jgi:hypothetical protein
MSITTITELQTAIADRLARSDFTTAQQNECIALCEARMTRTLSTLDMETVKVDYQIYAEFSDVPPNFNSVRSFMLNGSVRQPLTFMPDDTQVKLYTTTGCPRYFSVVGDQFRFAPVPGGTYTATLIYYQQIPPLATATPKNWMLKAHPDAYLYGSLYEAAIRVRDVDAAQGYKLLFDDAMASIQRDSAERRWGGNGMQTMVA